MMMMLVFSRANIRAEPIRAEKPQMQSKVRSATSLTPSRKAKTATVTDTIIEMPRSIRKTFLLLRNLELNLSKFLPNPNIQRC